MKTRHAIALLAAALAAPAVYAVQDCELNGQSVNPANGNTTEGKTGLMRCKDRDSGQLVREQELKAGKFMGVVRFYQDGKLKQEHSVNERGNRDGRAREFAPDGQVLRDSVYENGSEVGLARSYYASGQLRRATFYGEPGREQASVEYTERGQPNALRCADKPVLAPAADDARWCGFSGGPSTVEFFGSRGALNARSSYLNGKRVRHETFNDNGNPSYLNETVGNTRTERYYSTGGVRKRELRYNVSGTTAQIESEQLFSDGGTLTQDKRWQGGKLFTEQSFYLNGQPRSKTEFSGSNERGNGGEALVTEYYDSGKVAATGRYSVALRGRQTPIGTHQRLSESGRVVAESVYDDRGRIAREKSWDDNGTLLRDDEVFEDGSRKAYSR